MSAMNELGELSEALDRIKGLEALLAGRATSKDSVPDEVIPASGSLHSVTVQFPDTVTSCHFELRKLINQLTNTREIIDDRDDEISKLESNVEDLEEEVKALEESNDGDLSDRIMDFFAECERPVGSLKYTVPDTPSATRALLRLADSVTGSTGALL